MDYAKHLGVEGGASFLFVFFIPDRDREGNAIDQDTWVTSALELFGRLFRGATAFPKGRGVWRDDDRGGMRGGDGCRRRIPVYKAIRGRVMFPTVGYCDIVIVRQTNDYAASFQAPGVKQESEAVI